jgi:hypothetical protein
MSKRLTAVSLVFLLVFGPGTSLKAAEQAGSQSSLPSWEDQPGVVQPTTVTKEVTRGKQFVYEGSQRGFYLNVMQDCWPTDIEEWGIDHELENYVLTPDNVVLIWKHKIFESCENYMATVVGLPCADGKPPIIHRIAWVIPNIQFGYIQPGYEYLFSVVTTGMPVGDWDWFVVTECNDTNGKIAPPLKDGDIDDCIGANLGTVTYPLLVYGPEPAEVLDPDPGGFPPGRHPGEEGACRCWCFTVAEIPQCPSMEGIWDISYDWLCDSIDIANTTVQFNTDGTFVDSEGRGGTWSQDNCNVDWVYDNGTHYWGTMTTDGTSMEGEMLNSGGLDGCWWANRAKNMSREPHGNRAISASGNSFTQKK